MKIIGLDVGEKRIGVAKVDSSTKIAVPVGFIEHDVTVWDKLSTLARMNSTNWFVLGLPRSNEGNETKQTLYVRQFARTLVSKIPGARVRFQDESLTSVEAEARLKRRKKSYEKGEIDAEAATIILQDFIENFKNQPELDKKVAAAPAKPSNVVVDKVRQGKDKVLKEVDKATLNTMKLKKKTKKLKSIIIVIIIAAILAGIGAGAFFVIKAQRDKDRQEYFDRLEAEMKPDVFNFTIAPGETIMDVKAKLKQLTNSDGTPKYTNEEVETAFELEYNYDFLAGRPEGASLEGYLYGETHEFYSDAHVRDIINKFLEGTANVIEQNNLAGRYAERGLTLHQGITLASIIQKEAVASEMPTVAQVFLSRLEYGWLLGSDVTVTYALNVIDPNREIYGDNSSALTIDSCYNTRLYAGLPCGPISTPGIDALLSVANPSDTAYLYFLTGDDGVMYYSYTEAEHNQNAYLHCQTLCNVSL